MSDIIDRPGPYYPSKEMMWLMQSQNAEFLVPLRDRYNDAFGHLWLLIHLSFAMFPGQRFCLCFVLTCSWGFWDMNVTQREVCLTGYSASPRLSGRPLNSFFFVLTQNLCSVLLGSVNQTFYYNIIIFLPCPCQRTLNIILEPTPGLFESSVCFLLGVWLAFNRKHIHHV